MRLLTVAVAAVFLLGVACGGGGGGGETTDAITMTDNQFEPSIFTTSADTITVSNDGQALHSFTLEEGGIDLDIQAGDSAMIDLSALDAGTYDLTCKYHPEMTGQVTIE